MAESAATAPSTLEEKKAAAPGAGAGGPRRPGGRREAGLARVTDAAAAYIRAAAVRTGTQAGVRLRILAGGCSGLEYKLDLLGADETASPLDREVATNGVRVLMDLKSAIHVTGSVIDYESGLLRRGFRITNPDATGTCSCGDSFSA